MNKILKTSKDEKVNYALIPLIFPFTIPLFIMVYFLVKLEIQEHFIYGQVSEGTVEDISFYSNSTRGASIDHIKFHIKIPSKKVLIEANEQEEKLDKIDFPRDADFQRFKKGDKVTVKILNSYTVKILTYNGVEVNKYNNFFTLPLWWLLLFIILFLGILPYYIFFTRKKKYLRNK